MEKVFAFILDAVISLGVTNGLFVIFFCVAHLFIYWLYSGRLKDRQKEIDRMAEDCRQLREFFMKKLEEKL